MPGIKISLALKIESLNGTEKIPISNGTRNALAVNVNLLKEFCKIDLNHEMPVVKINELWEYYDSDNKIIKEDSKHNPEVEMGFGVKFKGTYKWIKSDTSKSPTNVSDKSDWKTIPSESQNSEIYESSIIHYNSPKKEIIAEISSPKTGLMIENENIIEAKGFDYSRDSVKVTFKYRVLLGSSSKTNDILSTLNIIESPLNIGKESDFSSITVPSNEYLVYAYPSFLGELKSIIYNNSFSVLSCFNKTVEKVISSSGLAIDYNVYTSSQKGAYTSSQLKFS